MLHCATPNVKELAYKDQAYTDPLTASFTSINTSALLGNVSRGSITPHDLFFYFYLFFFSFFHVTCDTIFCDAGDSTEHRKMALRSRAVLVHIAQLPGIMCWIMAIDSFAFGFPSSSQCRNHSHVVKQQAAGTEEFASMERQQCVGSSQCLFLFLGRIVCSDCPFQVGHVKFPPLPVPNRSLLR